MNIFVGSLPFSLSDSELRGYFEKYGEVSSVKIITDKFSGKSKGFGFVEMPDDEQAQKAIDELHGYEISGRAIVVNKAEERKDNPRKGGFGGGDSRGGYNKGGFNKGGGDYNKGGSSSGGFNKGGYKGGNRRSSY